MQVLQIVVQHYLNVGIALGGIFLVLVMDTPSLQYPFLHHLLQLYIMQLNNLVPWVEKTMRFYFSTPNRPQKMSREDFGFG